jgi:hypothetical protein
MRAPDSDFTFDRSFLFEGKGMIYTAKTELSKRSHKLKLPQQMSQCSRAVLQNHFKKAPMAEMSTF